MKPVKKCCIVLDGHGRSAQAFSVLLVIVAAWSFPAGSEELGRLFFTPERRQMLDQQRQFNLHEQEDAAEDPTITINGLVTRSSGKRTVWINGIAQDEKIIGNGLAVIPNRINPGKVVVQPDGAPAAKASVGDTVNRSTGETIDVLGNGRILIAPPPTKR